MNILLMAIAFAHPLHFLKAGLNSTGERLANRRPH